jgi:hypothetical protein
MSPPTVRGWESARVALPLRQEREQFLIEIKEMGEDLIPGSKANSYGVLGSSYETSFSRKPSTT